MVQTLQKIGALLTSFIEKWLYRFKKKYYLVSIRGLYDLEDDEVTPRNKVDPRDLK